MSKNQKYINMLVESWFDRVQQPTKGDSSSSPRKRISITSSTSYEIIRTDGSEKMIDSSEDGMKNKIFSFFVKMIWLGHDVKERTYDKVDDFVIRRSNNLYQLMFDELMYINGRIHFVVRMNNKYRININIQGKRDIKFVVEGPSGSNRHKIKGSDTTTTLEYADVCKLMDYDRSEFEKKTLHKYLVELVDKYNEMIGENSTYGYTIMENVAKANFSGTVNMTQFKNTMKPLVKVKPSEKMSSDDKDKIHSYISEMENTMNDCYNIDSASTSSVPNTPSSEKYFVLFGSEVYSSMIRDGWVGTAILKNSNPIIVKRVVEDKMTKERSVKEHVMLPMSQFIRCLGALVYHFL